MGRKRRRQQQDDEDNQFGQKRQHVEELPAGIHHYEHISEVPLEIQHYFRHRYKIWSRYNEGIWMTDNAWYGVSQELVAAKIASHVASMTPASRSILIDAFCGAGGNTIAFALSGRWKRVYAIEKDPATLECARRNAEIYGVKDKITWFIGDCFELLGKGANAIDGLRELVAEYGIIFGSPPWGGPGYKSEEIFDLQTMQPYTLQYIFNEFSSVTKFIVLYLPRTSDLRQIAECVEEGKKGQVVHYCARASSRALCAYLGDFQKLPPTA